MNWQYIANQVILFIATATALTLAVYAWRQRNAPGAKAFLWSMLLAGWLSLTNMLSRSSRAPATAATWFCLNFVTYAIIPVAWLAFALQHAFPQRQLTSRHIIPLMIIPIITQMVLWTNDSHQWFFRASLFEEGFSIIGETGSSIYGPWFWVHSVHSYILILSAVTLTIRAAIRTFAIYRGQAIALVVGTFVPLAGNMIETFAPTLAPEFNLMPLGFTFGGMAWGWATFRYHLFDVVPVARDTLIDSMNAGMLVLDAQNRIVDLNPALSNILGISAHQVIGQQAANILQPWHTLVNHLQIVTDVQTELSLEQDDILHHYELHSSLLKNRQGRLTGRLVVLHDITSRRQTEEALREYAAELEASNDELDAFAHTVAHDLKNPLSALIALSTFLEVRIDKMPSEDTHAKLNRITKNGYQISSIIDELLLLASVRQLEEIDIEILDMGSLVAKALDRLANIDEMRQAYFIIPKEWPHTLGYGPWVEEVWVNYISNALKYGRQPEAESPSKIELGFDEQTESQIRFWVHDNGPGLTEEQQSRLFTQFTRLHQIRAEGHGLGLSIVQRIINKLGGAVGVESKPGQGSKFYFTLPREENRSALE